MDLDTYQAAALLPLAAFRKNISGVYNAFSFTCNAGPCSVAELVFTGTLGLPSATGQADFGAGIFVDFPALIGGAHIAQYTITAGSTMPPTGWTLFDMVDSQWVAFSSIPDYVLVPGQPVTLSVPGFPLVHSFLLKCVPTYFSETFFKDVCDISELLVEYLPSPTPPKISSPTYGDGLYFGSVTTAGIKGEYFSFSSNVNIVAESYTIVAAPSDNPLSWALAGSANGGATFTLIDQHTETPILPGQENTIFVSSDTAFSIFRLVCTGAEGPSCWISSFQVTGTEIGPAAPTASDIRYSNVKTSSGTLSTQTLLPDARSCY